MAGAAEGGLGLVSLVGAGPGDPELLTVKAVRRLEVADLVLYDDLSLAPTVEMAPRAHRFFVGKRPGVYGLKQEWIHRVMVRAARRGQRVVRLKCGDPFVFGRGGEEALALAKSCVPFEVIPGVSPALAAAALAHIPVTHRGLASAFAVVSGRSEATYRSVIDSVLPQSLTLIVMMGLRRRAEIAEALMARGWPSETPMAMLLGASTPRSWSWIGTLGEVGRTALPSFVRGAPGTLVVGNVVSLGPELVATFHEPAAAALQSRSH